MKRNTSEKKIDDKYRHYCVDCGRKLYACDMIHLRIPLLKKDVWACRNCFCDNVLSTAEDKAQTSRNLVLLLSYRLEN